MPTWKIKNSHVDILNFLRGYISVDGTSVDKPPISGNTTKEAQPQIDTVKSPLETIMRLRRAGRYCCVRLMRRATPKEVLFTGKEAVLTSG